MASNPHSHCLLPARSDGVTGTSTVTSGFFFFLNVGAGDLNSCPYNCAASTHTHRVIFVVPIKVVFKDENEIENWY